MKNTDQASIDNRANQLNPNNPAYYQSRLENDDDDYTSSSFQDESFDDWDEPETYADDWEFNHD